MADTVTTAELLSKNIELMDQVAQNMRATEQTRLNVNKAIEDAAEAKTAANQALTIVNGFSGTDTSGFALKSDLAGYVSSDSLTTTLNGYVTSDSLTTALGGYVTGSNLTTTLGSYVTNSNLTTTLGSYVTNSNLTTTLGSYVTSDSLTTTLQNYATLDDLSSAGGSGGTPATGGAKIFVSSEAPSAANTEGAQDGDLYIQYFND